MKKTILATIIISIIFAAAQSIRAEDNWTNYFCGDEVNHIEIIADTLWAATNGGIVKWNLSNKTYEKYSSSEGVINSEFFTIWRDSSDGLWFGGFDGATYRKNGVWTNFSQYFHKFYSGLTMPDGNILVGSSNSVQKLEDGIFSDIKWVPAWGAVEDLVLDDQNRLWVATYFLGVHVYDWTSWDSLTTEDGLPSNQVEALEFDHEGNLWIGTAEGLCKYDGKNLTIYTVSDGLVANDINCIYVDSQDRLWYGTHSSGAGMFDGQNWHIYTSNYHLYWYSGDGNSGLPGDWITDVTEDKDGNIWFSSYQTGIAKYDGKKWFQYRTYNEPITSSIAKITVDKDNSIWVGHIQTEHFKDGRWKTFETPQPWSLAVDHDGVLWVGFFAAVGYYDGEVWHGYNMDDGIPNANILDILVDKENNKWFGGYPVTKFDGQNFTHLDTSNSAIDDYVWAMSQDSSGNYWFGTHSGLIKYDGNEYIKYTSDYYWRSEVGGGNSVLTDNIINAITVAADGTVWIGTINGVTKIQGDNWTAYNNWEHHCPMGFIKDIAVDQNNMLWVASYEDFGVAKFDGNKWTRYRLKEGLACNWALSVAVDQNNVKWFGTVTGLSRYDDNPSWVEIEEDGRNIPNAFDLQPNYPNPFNLETTIRYAIPEQSEVKITVFNLAGQLVRELFDKNQQAGQYSIRWDGKDTTETICSSGIYLYRMEAGHHFSVTRKMILLK